LERLAQIHYGKRVGKGLGVEATQFLILRCFALPDIAALESPNLAHWKSRIYYIGLC
jgi:hypothetical protein